MYVPVFSVLLYKEWNKVQKEQATKRWIHYISFKYVWNKFMVNYDVMMNESEFFSTSSMRFRFLVGSFDLKYVLLCKHFNASVQKKLHGGLSSY